MSQEWGNNADAYYSEEQCRKLCRYMIKKHGLHKLEDEVYDWFDGQLTIAECIGVYWQDLYLKALNHDDLFRGAALREKHRRVAQ